jgi:hypothetical protein
LVRILYLLRPGWHQCPVYKSTGVENIFTAVLMY